MDTANTQNAAKRAPSKMAYCAFFLALFSCGLGLFFCLAKSPQARALAYLDQAAIAIEQGAAPQAAAAAIQAVRLNPSEARAWYLLSNLLQQKGDVRAATQARAIAARVQQNPHQPEPVYAQPAAFKLSLLALAESAHP